MNQLGQMDEKAQCQQLHIQIVCCDACIDDETGEKIDGNEIETCT